MAKTSIHVALDARHRATIEYLSVRNGVSLAAAARHCIEIVSEKGLEDVSIAPVDAREKLKLGRKPKRGRRRTKPEDTAAA